MCVAVNHKNKTTTKRVFWHIKGNKTDPIVVFFAGIHGNELAGVTALKQLFETVKPTHLNGSVYGVYGNIKAIEAQKRFITSDLNRMWTQDNLDTLKTKPQLNDEEHEQQQLYTFLKTILNNTDNHKRPVYFIDLHTTSSPSLPFITINDALINRNFSKQFPVPIVLGIEEYLEGPLLSYLNTKGYVSLGFEGGQHQDPQSVENCKAFAYLVLKHTKVLKTMELNTQIEASTKTLRQSSKQITSVFEVVFKHHIQAKDNFEMKPGFKSFQTIKKGEHLAKSNGKDIYSKHTAMLFMPLYQKSGNDGFFIIKPISPFFLKLSSFLRRIKADQLLTFLPGIYWYNKKEGVLKAKLSVTRFMVIPVFHLFGYRNKKLNNNYLLLYNRERVSKKNMYKNEKWY